jgi:type I restriction-modification system DNA methylase subunit
LASLASFRETIQKLIRRFESDRSHYLSKNYSEAQARVDFITPYFKALGWDVENEEGLPHHTREVVVEATEDTRGRPDYGFRVSGQTKFFVEAKAPSEELDTAKHIIQAKTYAWNTKQVFFVVLTDFEEFRFYDASIQPDARKPDEGLLLKLKYTDYIARLEKLWEFSKERVLAGSLEAMLPRDRRTQRLRIPVDTAFLDEMTGWREEVARNVYKNNPDLTARQLNEIVQRLLDRIVFIRIAEDRHVIEKNELRDVVDEWKARGGKFHIFEWLNDLFHRINEDFNGEIFKPHLSEEIKIDSEVLARIIERLYPPQSPYRFDVIGVELLGSIYERYLGSTIRVTAKRVFVEEKPEVRKAGGVYYTPEYIVNYIVQNTVGKLIAGKSPKQIEKIRILDPACGSGSFLIGAFQCLIDYHVRYLAEHPKEAQVHSLFPDLIKGENGEPRLSVIRKAKILKNNLFGVDVDPQAVEITMMSLYLKALEGERSQLPPKQHLLPELKFNIMCGNSLIGPDIYEQGALFGDADRDRINAFDWNSEGAGFGRIMKDGGFDCVISNPPWGGDIDKELPYLHSRYPATTQDHTDSFKIFVEAGMRVTRNLGRTSMIVPSTILRQRRLRDVRQLLLRNSLLSIVDLGENVFKGVVAPSCIFVVRIGGPPAKHNVRVRDLRRAPDTERPKLLLFEVTEADSAVRQSVLRDNPEQELSRAPHSQRTAVSPLGEVPELTIKDAGINYQRVGVGMGVKGNSDLADRLLYEGKQERSSDRMFWKGSDITKYWIRDNTERFCRPSTRPRKNEVIHLNEEIFKTIPKILLRQTADTLIATMDYRGVWFGRSIIAILQESGEYKLEYLLGLLNSRYLRYVYQDLVHESGRVFAQVKLSKLRHLPFRKINFSDPGDKAQHDTMVGLVTRMIGLNRKKHSGNLAPSEIQRLEREITATDADIDDLVYKLYGVTDEERKIIAGGAT